LKIGRILPNLHICRVGSQLPCPVAMAKQYTTYKFNVFKMHHVYEAKWPQNTFTVKESDIGQFIVSIEILEY
jgi:hypothetical protein